MEERPVHASRRRRRCVVLVDGTTINSFLINTHETHTIVLEPSGHTYTYVHPTGRLTRHLSPTALSSHRLLVSDTIAIRNQFTNQTVTTEKGVLQPYLHMALVDPQCVRYQRKIHRKARWPNGTFYVQKLFNNATQRFEMQSIEGNATVCLHPSDQLLDLFVLVRVKQTAEESTSDEDHHTHAHYTTLHQTMTIDRVPHSFQYPLQVLLAAKDALRNNMAMFDFSPQSGVGVTSELPENAAFTARSAFPTISSTNSGGSNLTLPDLQRVATLPSTAFYRRVVVEVQEDADATFFISRDPIGSATVRVQLAQHPLSLLEGSGSFFRWFEAAGEPQQQFTIETIPPSALVASSSSYSMRAFCQHIDYLLKPAQDTQRIDSPSSQDTETAHVENVLVEQVENEEGRFRAFSNAKVRVVFADRTILQIDCNTELCSFFFADGSSGQTTVSAAPRDQQSYIQMALEFADWAYATHEERMLRYLRRRQTQEMASQELQRIHIRRGLNQSQNEDNTKEDTSNATSNIVVEEQSNPLSLPMIKKLQQKTLQHIARVQELLDASTIDRNEERNLSSD